MVVVRHLAVQMSVHFPKSDLIMLTFVALFISMSARLCLPMSCLLQTDIAHKSV